jgi:hypothetical protein
MWDIGLRTQVQTWYRKRRLGHNTTLPNASSTTGFTFPVLSALCDFMKKLHAGSSEVILELTDLMDSTFGPYMPRHCHCPSALAVKVHQSCICKSRSLWSDKVRNICKYLECRNLNLVTVSTIFKHLSPT